MELALSALPSRGMFYPNSPSVLHINTNSIEFLKLVSAADAENSSAYMIEAIALATGIVDPLTMGDYYALSTLLFSMTTKLDWEWKCAAPVVTFSTDQVGMQDYISELGFKSERRGDRLLVRTSSGASQLEGLQELKDMGVFGVDADAKGSMVNCDTHNKIQLTPELVVKQFIQLPDNLDTSKFQVTQARHIDEYVTLYADHKLRRLIGPISCLPDTYGDSLADKLRLMQDRPDFLTAFNEAADFFYQSKHGIRKYLSAPCSSCGYENVRAFRVSPSIFFAE